MSATLQRFDVTALEGLFFALESAGFKVGPAGRARALTLLTELIADDMLPEEGGALADWLTPIFVTRGADRDRFHDAVTRWSDSARRVEAPPTAPAPKAEPKPDWRTQAESQYPVAPPAPIGATRRAPGMTWLRRSAIAATALVVVLGLTFSGAPQAAWKSLQSWLQPRQQAAAPAPAAPANTAPAAQIDANQEAPAAADRPASYDALAAEIEFRAAPYKFAPTLEELSQPAEAFSGLPNVPALTVWDAPGLAKRLGVMVDQPLPLHREDFVARLLQVKAPSESMPPPVATAPVPQLRQSNLTSERNIRDLQGTAAGAQDEDALRLLAATRIVYRATIGGPLRALGCEARGDEADLLSLCIRTSTNGTVTDLRNQTESHRRLTTLAAQRLAASDLDDEMQTRMVTLEQLARQTRAQFDWDRQNFTDTQIARAWALYSFDTGTPLNLYDPPWKPAPPKQTFWQRNARYFNVALLAFGALLAIGAWLAAALNTRAFLARRKPEDPGSVADLAAEDRAKAERVDQPLRLAARRMLERSQSAQQIDLRATVDATARAGGFFTPMSRPGKRIPEYLFLIDMRSRADHDAKRAMQYVERLRAENVKVDVYFFERAPDRVRETPTSPLLPLETIVSTHATKRLVIVGDAAAMLSEGGKSVGPWAQTIAAWTERAVLTTVPADEWGKEEETLATSLGALVRPLSTAALAALPAQLRDEEADGEKKVLREHDLADHPLPAPLRASPHRWLSDEPVEPETLDAMLSDLRAYLGLAGFRWLSACAIYPAIEWDLSMALSWRLKDAAGEAIASESRIALLSELPWMRAGQMPDWLRARLINEMSSEDRQVVRAFLAEMLDAARAGQPRAKDQISLSFSVEGRRGREAYEDDVFVSFLLGERDSRDQRTLDASKTVRKLLLPPLAVRLFRPQELGLLFMGLMFAFGAFLFAPRLNSGPVAASAWAGVAAMALAPILLRFLGRPVAASWRATREFLFDPIGRIRDAFAPPGESREDALQRQGAAALRWHMAAWSYLIGGACLGLISQAGLWYYFRAKGPALLQTLSGSSAPSLVLMEAAIWFLVLAGATALVGVRIGAWWTDRLNGLARFHSARWPLWRAVAILALVIVFFAAPSLVIVAQTLAGQSDMLASSALQPLWVRVFGGVATVMTAWSAWRLRDLSWRARRLHLGLPETTSVREVRVIGPAKDVRGLTGALKRVGIQSRAVRGRGFQWAVRLGIAICLLALFFSFAISESNLQQSIYVTSIAQNLGALVIGLAALFTRKPRPLLLVRLGESTAVPGSLAKDPAIRHVQAALGHDYRDIDNPAFGRLLADIVATLKATHAEQAQKAPAKKAAAPAPQPTPQPAPQPDFVSQSAGARK